MATLNDRILYLSEHTEDKIDEYFIRFKQMTRDAEKDNEFSITPLVKGKPLY